MCADFCAHDCKFYLMIIQFYPRNLKLHIPSALKTKQLLLTLLKWFEWSNIIFARNSWNLYTTNGGCRDRSRSYSNTKTRIRMNNFSKKMYSNEYEYFKFLIELNMNNIFFDLNWIWIIFEYIQFFSFFPQSWIFEWIWIKNE